MGSQENVCPQACGGWGGRGALARELRRLAGAPPPGVRLLGGSLRALRAELTGPADSPYAGGLFRVRLLLDAYPARPPRAVFETRVFHPNVAAGGEVCVSTLARDWRPALGLAAALVALRELLLAPNADSALNADAARLLQDDYAGFFARARLYTDIHAAPAHSSHSSPPQDCADESQETGGEGPSAKREKRIGGAMGGATSDAISGKTGGATSEATGAAASAARPAGVARALKRRILKRL